MATGGAGGYLKSGGGIVKRLGQQLDLPPPSFFLRRAHTTMYDKNLDEQVRPTIVPDEVIQSQPDKYWEPHPKTGVFGPVSTTQEDTCAGAQHASSAAKEDNPGPVLDEKAWFRPTSLEDLEKPHHA